MIEYQELRIGNLVRYNEKLFRIYSISKEYPFLDTQEFGQGCVLYQELYGIILTPEILEKCGFEKKLIGDKIYYSFSLFYGLSNYEFAFYPFFDLGNGINAAVLLYKGILIGGNLYYVHELQNIYFALTGKELKIKF